MIAAAMMPRPGAANGVVPKNGIGIAFWIAGVPGSADIVKVEVPRKIAAGIKRLGMLAPRDRARAMGTSTKKRNEQADAAIGDECAGEHDGQHRPARPQPRGHEFGERRDRTTVFHQLAE